ncbi:hypothetical protein DFH08DRAFT_719256 [Mycena albidolilacea]|uniref:BTB domain-containing protein n=1 Tax=Mycena albidolilacea TaxID=1033008 RepID=A0AAD6Z6G0_9AGAR|nr:hypothetical protein DFH08DRAFT_719256 [Mycena albidolilacea]
MDPFQPVYSPGDAGAPEVTPSRQIWFSDGNIILEAANTSFRVYSQLVAAKSTVLADILAFPQYTLHEIPVVRLLDAAEDLKALLRAILDSNFFMPPPSPTHLSTVLAILQLASKYDITYLFQRALLHLDTLYPTDLNNFLAISPTSHITFPEPPISGHLEVLKAAMDVDAPWLLPAVHYSIACAPLRQIIVLGTPWAALPELTRNLILMAHSWRLDRCHKVHAFALRNEPRSASAKCTDQLGCARAVAHCARTLMGLIARDQPVDPLRFWDEVGLARYEGVRCTGCRAGMREESAQAREDVWAGLPRTFECATWPELREMKEATMARAD